MTITPSNRLIPVLHQLILAEDARNKRQPRHFSASGILKCQREWVYALSGYPPEPVERKVEWILAAELGNMLHAFVARMFQTGGILQAEEEPISGQPYSGRIDYRLVVEADGEITYRVQLDVDGEMVVADLKSMNSRDYNAYDAGDKRRSAHAQLMAYLEATGLVHGYIIAVNRDSLEMKEYEVTYAPKHASWIVDRAKRINSWVAAGIIPEWDIEKPYGCRFCAYRTQCDQDGPGEIQKGAKK